MINNKYLLIIIFFVSAHISLDAIADSIKRADADDIKFLLNAATGVNSAYWSSIIGETNGRIYIQYSTAIHSSSIFTSEPKHVVYWLPHSEISNETLLTFYELKAKYEPNYVNSPTSKADNNSDQKNTMPKIDFKNIFKMEK